MSAAMLFDARAEALFASPIQPSQCPSAVEVQAAVADAVKRLRTRGCACCVAQEFGDHPDTAAPRMVWCRQTVAATWGGIR